jgi:hypothetical protein
VATLKDRRNQIPNGFQYRQPEINYVAPQWQSFDAIVKAVQAARTGNPFLARKHRWATDYAGVAHDVDVYNAKICQAHGWNDWITEASPDPPKWLPQPLEWPGAAGSVKRTTAGVKLVMDWLGQGLKPVAAELAEKRAAVCAVCPLNSDPNWIQRLDAIAAQGIRHLVEVKNDLKLKTSYDEKLHTCQACDCYLKLKPWTPLDVVLSNLGAETKAKLDPNCWILSEGA